MYERAGTRLTGAPRPTADLGNVGDEVLGCPSRGGGLSGRRRVSSTAARWSGWTWCTAGPVRPAASGGTRRETGIPRWHGPPDHVGVRGPGWRPAEHGGLHPRRPAPGVVVVCALGRRSLGRRPHAGDLSAGVPRAVQVSAVVLGAHVAAVHHPTGV